MALPSVRSTTIIAVIVGVALTTLFGYLTTQPGAYGYVAAPLVIGACVLFIITGTKPLWLFPIVAALAVFILAIPFAGAQVIAADFVVGCIILTWSMSRPRQPISTTGWQIVVPFIVFIMACIITIPISSNTSFGIVKVVQRVEFLLLMAGTIALLRDRAMLRRTIDAYLLGCLALALLTLGFAALHGVQRGGVNVLFYNKNAIASFLCMGLPLVIARILFKVSPQQGRWIALALTLSGALLITGSRGGWMGTIVAIGVLTGLRNRRALIRYIIVAGILVIVMNAVLPDDLTRISQFNTANLSSPSAGGTVLSRLILWSDAVKLIAAHPILGVGVGGYLTIHNYHGDTQDFSTNDPHNAFLYMWGELGTVGLLAFIFLLVAIFRMANKGRRATRNTPDYWLAVGCFAALSSYLVYTLTEPIWVRGDGLVFFLLVGITTNLATGVAYKPLSKLDADINDALRLTQMAGARG
jgi:O-antigen ligase